MQNSSMAYKIQVFYGSELGIHFVQSVILKEVKVRLSLSTNAKKCKTTKLYSINMITVNKI